MTATDARTVSIKLKEPVVYVLQLLASYGSFTGNVVIIPKETESGFDIRRDMIGTGPFYLDNYTPSVSYTLKRNADYWDPNAATSSTRSTTRSSPSTRRCSPSSRPATSTSSTRPAVCAAKTSSS